MCAVRVQCMVLVHGQEGRSSGRSRGAYLVLSGLQSWSRCGHGVIVWWCLDGCCVTRYAGWFLPHLVCPERWLVEFGTIRGVCAVTEGALCMV